MEHKKPADEPRDAPKDAPKPGQPSQRGPGVPGGPGPFVESPEPKEKQQGAPATSENEAIKRQDEKAAAGQQKLKPSVKEPEGHLKPWLQRLQAEAAHPEPAHVGLIPPKRDETGHVEPGALAAPAADPGGPVPRVISPNERAPAGLARFRIRSDDNYGPQPVRYVLARSEREAAAHYLEATGLSRLIERLADDAPDPMLSVRQMAD